MALLPIFTFTCLGAIYIFPPWVLFGKSFTLKAKQKLTTRINCFHLCSIIFQIGNLYVGQNSRLNRRSGREGRELQPITAWRQFLPFSPPFSWAKSSLTQYSKIEIPNKTFLYIGFSPALHLLCPVKSTGFGYIGVGAKPAPNDSKKVWGYSYIITTAKKCGVTLT